MICNKQFEQPDKHILPGMAKDEISISLVLAQLGYEVDVEQDLTAEVIVLCLMFNYKIRDL